tara:strand:+ start:45 stop:437 length:393 start_codon:yes stop_codon:yes gene_type:complete
MSFIQESAESVAMKFGLKKCGSEWKGPCPKCGGHDRFSVREGKSQAILAHCRHCGDRVFKELIATQPTVASRAPKFDIEDQAFLMIAESDMRRARQSGKPHTMSDAEIKRYRDTVHRRAAQPVYGLRHEL